MQKKILLTMLCVNGFLVSACNSASSLKSTGKDAPGGITDASTPSVTATDGGNAGIFKHVFVTSGKYDGNRGAISGADALCTTLAKGASLPGEYKAWLSSSTENARDRIKDVGPWYQVKPSGEKVLTFNNASQLSGTPLVAIQYSENSSQITSECAWTATNTGGTYSGGENCDNFRSASVLTHSTVGLVGSTEGWTSYNCTGDRVSCEEKHHIYCFEQ